MLMSAIAFNLEKLMKFITRKRQVKVGSVPLPEQNCMILTAGGALSTIFGITATIKLHITKFISPEYWLA